MNQQRIKNKKHKLNQNTHQEQTKTKHGINTISPRTKSAYNEPTTH